MARPSSIALAGYFPTPTAVLPSLASLVSFTPDELSRYVLLDPCAGDAAAIATLRTLWNLRPADALIHAIELEAVRAQDHRHHLPGTDNSMHCDAFNVDIKPDDGASLLFLNPPYDHDRVHGRLEQRFLERWTSALLPEFGILMFLVPHYALSASAAFLAVNFHNIRAWRLPDPHFDTFKQCILVGQRRLRSLQANALDAKRIERWAADASTLPILSTLDQAPYQARACGAGLGLEEIPLDVRGLVAGFRPWHRATFAGLDRGVSDMVGAKFPVAQPPRPAHIALALSAGTLNGKVLSPNEPGLPPILVKGSFRRFFQPVEQRFDKFGEHVGTIMVQRPKLTLCVLRLDSLEFLDIKAGAIPSGAKDLADFNSADLVEHYGTSLGQLMREQLPALHDPANPGHAMQLPKLARQPLRVQENAIIAGLKLLANGKNPQAVAEVGTGKSTVSLSIVGALSPPHFRRTTAELQRLGFDTSRLKPVRRILILCPPHLLTSWHDQAAAVLPDHSVVTVKSIADLRQDAQIYVLSREVAKLGHGFQGVAGIGSRPAVCPRCGTELTLSSSKQAETRARCSFISRLPSNEEALVAEDLAVALMATHPYDPLVRGLVAHHRILAKALPPPLAGDDSDEPDEADMDPEQPAAAPSLPSPDRLLSVARQLVDLLARKASTNNYRLKDAVLSLSQATGLQDEVAQLLHVRAEALLAKAAAALETSDSYHDAVWIPQRLGEELLALADALRRPVAAQRSPTLLAVLGSLHELGTWEESEPCGEPLFQATPEPRRYPLARYILRYCKRMFDILIADEAQDYSNKGSAQQRAAHRLVELPGVPTIALSGTIMGGYAGSLFANMWALSGEFRERFKPWEQQAFITAYGYRKVYVPAGTEDLVSEVVGYGSTTDRAVIREAPIVRQMGQAPGVLPLFILRHLLPEAVIMHKADLDDELPPSSEIPAPITVSKTDKLGQEMLDEFNYLLSELTRRIQADRFSSLAGKLWGAMGKLPSYLDCCTADLQPFVLSYPKEVGGEIVAEGKMFPATWVTPKEQYVLDRVWSALRDGRNVLVFLRHTGSTGLPARYLRLFKEHLGQRAVFLDVRKVKAAQREHWLNEQVIQPGCRILVTNPKAVQTGLNNLVHFSRGLWVEGLDYDARVVRQANGRLHRMGQVRDVEIEVPYYQGTIQKLALDLVARKITASVQVDALSIEGALETAGAGDDEDQANQAAMGMGKAIYDAWSRR